MVSPLKLTEITKKWHGGGKVTSPTAAACPRGHFAAYTRDGRRFFIPIAYLGTDTFRELLNMAEEEFGAPGGRPIVLPCSGDRLDQILDAFRAAKQSKGSGAGAGRVGKIW
ncbi:hypothetical protein ACP70R_022959 [Stipagrostis hirtigluma subsp. patula]